MAISATPGVPPNGAPTSAAPPRGARGSRLRRVALRAEAVLMLSAFVAVGAAIAFRYREAVARPAIVPGVRLLGRDVSGLDRAEATAVALASTSAELARPITLAAGQAEARTTAAALGAIPVPGPAIDAAFTAGRTGNPLHDLAIRVAAFRGTVDHRLGVRFDATLALAELHALAPAVDRPSLPTRLDLEARTLLAAESGTALLAYDALSPLAVGLARGASRIELPVVTKPPAPDPLAELADDLDVRVALGTFETPYSLAATDADRTHNLMVGAAAIDGTVILPGATFSFNTEVGPRTPEHGYRYGTGIAGGELIDVVGGGICQVSSTLFGAAFFAGLEVVSARPHSRPSNYVDMGLDSTVVWPNVDLVLRNPYDFPVVLHMTASRGKARAEVLGPRRPYQVAFERTLSEVLPYETVWRDDDRLRTGETEVAQRGMRGFVIVRERKRYQGGKEVGREAWTVRYPATHEIVRRGTNPTGVPAVTHEPPPRFRDPAPQLRIMQ